MSGEASMAVVSVLWFMVFVTITDMVFDITTSGKAVVLLLFVIASNLLMVFIVAKMLARHVSDEYSLWRKEHNEV